MIWEADGFYVLVILLVIWSCEGNLVLCKLGCNLELTFHYQSTERDLCVVGL